MTNLKDFKSLVSGNYVLIFWGAQMHVTYPSIISIIEELKSIFKVGIEIYFVDVDEYSEVASKYQIKSIPTVAMFKNGDVVDFVEGLSPKQTYTEMIKRNL